MEPFPPLALPLPSKVLTTRHVDRCLADSSSHPACATGGAPSSEFGTRKTVTIGTRKTLSDMTSRTMALIPATFGVISNFRVLSSDRNAKSGRNWSPWNVVGIEALGRCRGTCPSQRKPALEGCVPGATWPRPPPSLLSMAPIPATIGAILEFKS